MKIKWNGHASFTITASDKTVIVTDPYDPSGYGGALKYAPVNDQADGVLVSHDHADHNFVAGLPGSPEVIRDAGSINNIHVKGIPTHHDESGGKERGNNVVFVFSVDGVRICFVGDLGHQLTADQIREIGSVDLLLLPVGGTFTVDAAGAAGVADSLNPRLIIPMHFKTEKCDFPIATVDDFLGQVQNVKQIHRSEIMISKEDFPASGYEVWVLDHAL